jgi:hypothetical protein
MGSFFRDLVRRRVGLRIARMPHAFDEAAGLRIEQIPLMGMASYRYSAGRIVRLRG